MAGETQAETAAGTEQRYAQVALKLPLRREFTYRVPAGMQAQVGCRVRVPFRGRTLPGVVTDLSGSCDVPAEKLRDVEQVLDADQLMPPALLQLARKMAEDYGCSLGEALDAALPAATKRSAARRIPHLELNIPPDIARQAIEELEEKQQPRARVLRRLLEFGAAMPIMQLRRQTGTSDSPWKTLVKQGMLRRSSVLEKSEPLVPDAAEAAERHELNDDQSKAVNRVGEFLDAGEHRVFLLHGVTGSGKTEVYLRIL
ncbi:MAG: primosomal protein N' family DNA-binding protein, partial [Planctomycetota bacterium]